MTSKFLSILIAFVLMAGLILVTAPWKSGVDEQARSTLIALGKTGQIQQQMDVLATAASNYLEVAPREYDDYFRDTKVFHPTLLALVESLDAGFASLEALPLDTDIRHREVAEQWRQFHRRLDEQLGVDPEVPRLEWGAEHIGEALPELHSAVDALHASLNINDES